MYAAAADVIGIYLLFLFLNSTPVYQKVEVRIGNTRDGFYLRKVEYYCGEEFTRI